MEQPSRIEPSDFHPDYRQAEERFHAAGARLVERELELQAHVRSLVEAGIEERQEHYIEGHNLIEAEYNRLAEEFGRTQGQALAEAERTLYRGGGTENYQRCLAQASNTPDEKLPELAQLATQSGLRDLEQAVAIVSAQRNPSGTSEIFRDWLARDPKRQAAHERLKGTPKRTQFYARTRAVKPPKAKPADLEPTAMDLQKAAEEKAQKAAPRHQFFGGTPQVRRQVGSRVS